jgi:zinc-ribbon domain
VITCPNCGTKNEPGSRFCFQCGTDIRNARPDDDSSSAPLGTPPPGFPPPPPPPGFPSAQQPPGFPPPSPPGFPPQYQGGVDPARQGWAPSYMTPPEQPKRRRWLWITLGLILGCIILCVALSLLAGSSDTVADMLTSVSEFSTEEAGN